MSFFHAGRVACVIGLASVTTAAWLPQRAWAQYAEAPSLFPIPLAGGFTPLQPAAERVPGCANCQPRVGLVRHCTAGTRTDRAESQRSAGDQPRLSERHAGGLG